MTLIRKPIWLMIQQNTAYKVQMFEELNAGCNLLARECEERIERRLVLYMPERYQCCSWSLIEPSQLSNRVRITTFVYVLALILRHSTVTLTHGY